MFKSEFRKAQDNNFDIAYCAFVSALAQQIDC